MATQDWLTRELVEGAFSAASPSNVQVSSIAVSPLVDSMGNLASNLKRIRAETSQGTKDLIIKTLPTGEFDRLVTEVGGKFRREFIMYEIVLPGMHRLLDGHVDVYDVPLLPTSFAPDLTHVGVYPNKYILLEDLSRKGFRVCDSGAGLALPHALLAVRTLALFHAASVAYLMDNPQTTKMLENPYDLLVDYYEMTIRKAFPLVAKKCKEWDKFRPFKDILVDMVPKGIDKLISSHSHRGNHFNVICHGDFCINNLMFRYDGCALKEVRFIDFQMSHVTSPAADLLYFFATSLNEKVCTTWWGVVVKEYCAALHTAMLSLHMSPLSFLILERDLNANSIIAVHTSVTVMPFAKANIQTMQEEFLNEGGCDGNSVYNSEDVETWLQILLEQLAIRGWIRARVFKPSRRTLAF